MCSPTGAVQRRVLDASSNDALVLSRALKSQRRSQPAAKPLPLIVMTVPPKEVPAVGYTEETIGNAV